jgi:hypothetical protein
MRRTAFALAIIIAFVAVVVPTCRMVGCTMDMGAMMHGMGDMAAFSADCAGTLVMSSSPVAIVPSGADTLTLALVAAVVAALALLMPAMSVRPVFVMEPTPPPPPLPTRGERFRV